MAAKLLPYSIVTLMTLSGFNYTTHYQHPKADNKPYILFIHGFPSSAYDWRHQVEHFSKEGYGIIAPDTLGYGGTSKPLDPHNYLLKGIGDSIVEVINKVAGEECKVLGVGHDWGTALLSRLANFHPDRFLSYSFLAGGYVTPGPVDLDLINAETKATLGYSTFGYWKFFNESDAGPIIDSHQESFTDLIYPQNMSEWKAYMGPVGASRAWLEANTTGPYAPYISKKEFKTHQDIFRPENGGYTPALGYYRGVARGYNDADNSRIVAPGNSTSLPTQFIRGTTDPSVVASAQIAATLAFAPHAIIQNVSAGHWIQLEKPAQINQMLDGVFKEAVESAET